MFGNAICSFSYPASLLGSIVSNRSTNRQFFCSIIFQSTDLRFNFSQRETRVVTRVTRELREKLKEKKKKKKKTREVKPVIAIPDIYLFPSPIRLPFEAYGRCENVDDAVISVVYDDDDDEDEKRIKTDSSIG